MTDAETMGIDPFRISPEQFENLSRVEQDAIYENVQDASEMVAQAVFNTKPHIAWIIFALDPRRPFISGGIENIPTEEHLKILSRAMRFVVFLFVREDEAEEKAQS